MGSSVSVVRTPRGHHLERNGQPFFIRGAVGSIHLERLTAAGGNAIRAGVAQLDKARALDLTVLVGLPVGKQRWGFDYGDAEAIAQQRETIRDIVRAHRDHPALLMWALGNELEIHTTPEQRVPLWQEVNRLAEMIHDEDPDHPVITVLGDAFRKMLPELDDHCSALDAVGLNAYADMLTLPEDIARHDWERPYLITEFGPRGHWQVKKTPWGMPIEDSSTEKAEFYYKAYRHAVADRPHCLGSFVFHWAQHHEKTHTWYGMFLPDGSPTGAVDVMQYLWTGRWPENRCPQIGPRKIVVRGEGGEAGSAPFRPGERLRCLVDAIEPDGDPFTVVWDLRRDVADNANVGGDREEPTPPIEGAVLETRQYEAVVQLPAEEGFYRLFVYVYADNGGAATANVPLVVAAEPAA